MIGEQARGFEDVGEVEERLALAHHDDVQAVDVGFYALVAGYSQDLPYDLACGQAAFEAHQCCQAEFAIYGAADLAGDADGGAFAFGHPDGFYGFAVVEFEQVAAGTVGGVVDFGDLGEAQGEGVAEGFGDGSDFVEAGDALVVDGFVDLLGSEFGVAGAEGGVDFGHVHTDDGGGCERGGHCFQGSIQLGIHGVLRAPMASAMIAVTRLLMLTPSCSARAVNLE